MAEQEQEKLNQMTSGAAAWGPEGCKYSQEHEWARGVDEEIVWIGISDYAANELGDVVFVQLPAVGTTIKQAARFGEIESVKAVSDLFAPVSGEIVAVNDALLQHPELVNQSPFGLGWMIGVRVTDATEADQLMDPTRYESYLRELQQAEGAH